MHLGPVLTLVSSPPSRLGGGAGRRRQSTSGDLGFGLLPPPALVLGRRQVVDGTVKPTLVPPVHQLGGGQLDLLEVPPGPATADELGLVQAHHCLGQGVPPVTPPLLPCIG